MPNLKPEQIIESLVKTSNANAVNGFDKLSRSTGVIDVAKASEYAYTNFYKSNAPANKNAKTPKKKKAVKTIDKLYYRVNDMIKDLQKESKPIQRKLESKNK